MPRLLRSLLSRLQAPAEDGADLSGGSSINGHVFEGADDSTPQDESFMSGEGGGWGDEDGGAGEQQAAPRKAKPRGQELQPEAGEGEGDDEPADAFNEDEGAELEAGSLEGGDDEPADPTKVDPNDPTDTWEAGGQKFSATRSQMREAMQKVSDYTHKTTQAAEGMRQATALAGQAQQFIANRAQQLDAMIGALQQEIIGNAPDVSLIATNPQEYLAQQAMHQRRVTVLQQAMQTRQASGQEAEQLDEGQRRVKMQREHAALMDAIPSWRNPQVRAAEESLMAQMLAKYGFTADEVKGMTDHRAFAVTRIAARALAREAQQRNAKPTPQGQARTLKPGASTAGGPKINRTAQNAKEALRANRNNGKALESLVGSAGW